MQDKFIKDNIEALYISKLSDSEDYYNNVFKKTERVISATFYILSFTETNSVHYKNISDKCFALHAVVLDTLPLTLQESKDGLFPLKQSLVALQSSLVLAESARLLLPEAVFTISSEIDLVLRFLRNHYSNGTELSTGLSKAGSANSHLGDRSTKSMTPRVRRGKIVIPQNDLSSDAVLVYSDLNDRTTRIKTVLEAKPNATIKDLTDIITDVSSKTIQRELNSLIENGEVKREGERRWSTYTLLK